MSGCEPCSRWLHNQKSTLFIVKNNGKTVGESPRRTSYTPRLRETEARRGRGTSSEGRIIRVHARRLEDSQTLCPVKNCLRAVDATRASTPTPRRLRARAECGDG